MAIFEEDRFVNHAIALLVSVEDVIQQPETWVYSKPATDGVDLLSIMFVIKSSKSEVTVYKVDRWEMVTSRTASKSETAWTFHFGKRRHCGDHLFDKVLSCADGPLTTEQQSYLEKLTSDGSSNLNAKVEHCLIKNAPVSLDEAKDLVARYYSVSRDQVLITISS